MKLTAKLALSQIKINRNRSVMTVFGIALSSAMLTAVCGFVMSAKETVYTVFGMDADAPMHSVLIAMGAILGGIIMIASVIVMSNAFRVSAGERTRQFGILKSVGATKKQIASSVLYEGVFLSVVGIPVGIGIGLLIELFGVSIITNLLESLYEGGTLNVDSEMVLSVPFSAPPIMFIAAVLTSFLTVLISAWLPARKAAKIPAIDAIRKTSDVKIKSKHYRTFRVTQILFGFEGTLAAKSLKRSRRSFRATVLSLTISIILLIVAGSFGTLMQRSVNTYFTGIDVTAAAEWSSAIYVKYEDESTSSTSYISMNSETAQTINDKLSGYDGAAVFGVGANTMYATTLPGGTNSTCTLVMVDTGNYEKLCKSAGVPVGSNLLVNFKRETKDGRIIESNPHKYSDFASKSMTFTLSGYEPIDLTINGELRNVPNEIGIVYGYFDTVIIVPDCNATRYSWYVNVEDTTGFVDYSKSVLEELAPKSDEIETFTTCMDISSVTKQMNNMIDTVMFFVYGFVGMLTLIAVTSVISTISTNIRSRAGEFAVLESVGMTRPGIRKMLNLESVMCSLRSLIYGIPIGLISAYGLYFAMQSSIALPFEWPWLVIAGCVLGVFVITWITMRYAASRLKDGNIIETIRGNYG